MEKTKGGWLLWQDVDAARAGKREAETSFRKVQCVSRSHDHFCIILIRDPILHHWCYMTFMKSPSQTVPPFTTKCHHSSSSSWAILLLRSWTRAKALSRRHTHTYIHTYTHTHTHMHIHIHAHTHTHMQHTHTHTHTSHTSHRIASHRRSKKRKIKYKSWCSN